MYDFIHLKTFVVLAEELHFRRAAERLHLTQPPLSQRLRTLEESVGTTLLKRSTRSVELTESGKVFLEGARDILKRLEELNLQTQLAATGHVGQLRIGFVPSASYVLLPKVLRKFKNENPRVDIHLEEMAYLRILEHLQNRMIDVALLRTSARERAIENYTAMRESLILAIPRSHPLARARSVSIQDLEGQPFIAFSAHDSPYFSEKINQLFADAGVRPHVVQYSLIPTILSFVEADIGLSIVPESVQHIANPNVVYKTLHGQGKAKGVALTAAWHKNHSSTLLTKFIETLKAIDSDTSVRRASTGKSASKKICRTHR